MGYAWIEDGLTVYSNVAVIANGFFCPDGIPPNDDEYASLPANLMSAISEAVRMEDE